ncbi:MAG TPA: hypothetical protein VF808_03390 [Ktedonobacterales bacterium]
MTARVHDWARGESSPQASDTERARSRLPVKHIVTQALGMWVVTRLAFIFITVMAYAFGLAPYAPTAHTTFGANPTLAPLLLPLLSPMPVWANWAHWDANWYLLIGTHGYAVVTADSTGFFPLYPLAIAALTSIFGQQAVLPVALFLSNMATLAAFIGLGLIGAYEKQRQESAENASARLIAVTAAYPFAFFLFAPFTEGFFLAGIVYTFYCARRGYWGWATVFALLAGLTRPTALALIPALAWEFGRQRGFWRAEAWRAGAWRTAERLRDLAVELVVVTAMPAGLAGYLVFLKVRYGHALSPFTAQRRYHEHSAWPFWKTLGVLLSRMLAFPAFSPATALLYFDGALLLVFLIVAILNVARLPVFYSIYMLTTLGFLLSTPDPHRIEVIPSVGRYLLMSTPIFLLFTRWMRGRPALQTLLIGGGFMLQALFTVLFLGDAWIE